MKTAMTQEKDKKRQPAYMEIYQSVRQDIVSGRLRPGQKLVSKRALAEELGLSVITVEHAYELLADEGYIRARERSGFYVADNPDKRPLPPVSGTREAVAGVSAAGEDFPFSVFAGTMRRVLSERGRGILVRSDGQGCPELREAIAAYLERSRGIEISPDNIVIGSGAEYLYSLLVQLLGRDGVFGLEEPGYETIRRVYELNGASCRRLKMGENGILSEELEGFDGAAIHVTPYRSFPSGVTADAVKRREYAAWAAERGAYVVEDDYDGEMAAPASRIDTIFSLAPDRVVYINTYTKTLAPSMRMGYMLLPEELLKRYREKMGFMSCTVPLYEQYVLAEFINSGELERHIRRRRRKARENACGE